MGDQLDECRPGLSSAGANCAEPFLQAASAPPAASSAAAGHYETDPTGVSAARLAQEVGRVFWSPIKAGLTTRTC